MSRSWVPTTAPGKVNKLEHPPSSRLGLASENEATEPPFTGEITECKSDPTAHLSLDKQNPCLVGREGPRYSCSAGKPRDRGPRLLSRHLTATVLSPLSGLFYEPGYHGRIPDTTHGSIRTRVTAALGLRNAVLVGARITGQEPRDERQLPSTPLQPPRRISCGSHAHVRQCHFIAFAHKY